MKTLPISVNNITDSPLTLLQPLLQQLKDSKQLDVTPEVFDWGLALHALNKIATYHNGPVVSQIGTTWMGDLVPQRVLRPFTARDITSLGGQDIFFPSAWQTTRYLGEPEVFSIPWLSDTNIIFYRRDALQKAGINESTAFATLDALSETVTDLRSSGHPLPWVASSGILSLSLVHHVSNWVFGRGGAFVSSSGQRAEFNSPAARAGIRQYFELQRFLTPDASGLTDPQTAERYFSGQPSMQAAVMLASPSYLHNMQTGAYPPEVVENTGVAVPPGIPFIGGSNWVIWSHISPMLERAALDFLAFMSSHEAQEHMLKQAGLLPARMDALSQSSENDYYQVVQQTLQKGLPFPSTRLWGLVEKRLTEALFEVSNALLANPRRDLEAILDERLAPVESRLNLTLSS